MTKVAQIFEREKQEALTELSREKDLEINIARREATVFKMLLHGDTVIHISQVTGMSEDEINELMK